MRHSRAFSSEARSMEYLVWTLLASTTLYTRENDRSGLNCARLVNEFVSLILKSPDL